MLAPDVIQQEHQADVEARDWAFELEDKRRAAGRASRKTTPLGEIGALERAHDSGYDSSSDAEQTSKDESETEPINADEPMDDQSTNLCTNPRKSTMHTTHKWDTIDNLRKMNDQLAGKPVTTLTPYKKKPFPKPKDEFKPVAVNIAAISANCMHFNMKREENEAFTTSLYKIDQIMEDRYRESEEYKLWA